MSKKYTIDTIKDLKVRVRELGDTALNYYTKHAFEPDSEFHITKEECDVPEIAGTFVPEMIAALENSETEFEAGKILYEKLRLTPKQASDIAFWTYHNHSTFYPYIAKRWDALWQDDRNKSGIATYIINHWIQSNSSQGELIVYPISGLWWSFFLTVDESRENKYELTQILFKNYSLRTQWLGSSRFGRHKPAMHGVLEFIVQNGLDKSSMESAGRAIVQYVNLIGGIRPLTYFDKEWFKQKLNNRFGEQIKKGERLFLRPGEEGLLERKTTAGRAAAQVTQDQHYDRYFCLNALSGNYKITSRPEENWDYCIGIDFTVKDQFTIHFYKEGKIKKTKINGNFSEKTVDREKPYSNGKCPRLTLSDLQLISGPVLFGIAYQTRFGIFFKAMDEQNKDFFRTDNAELNQEGKKVLYLDEPFEVKYKILPHELKDQIGTLTQTPLGKGADITNKYYEGRWIILRKYWPELFESNANPLLF